MTELERLQEAKIPCKETGIEVKHTFCSVCEPLFHCGIDAYVKDGRVVKIEGTPDYPVSNGNLCPKGHANRQYIYRADRIQTPLRRTGPRGSGQFEEISWEEAYREIAARLKQLKAAYGPESVLFYSGYAKWYRSFLQRLAHSFGSPNFGSESSTCHMATVEAWKDMVGTFSAYDVQNAATFMAWAVNPYHSKPTQLRQLYEVKERGQKIVVIAGHPHDHQAGRPAPAYPAGHRRSPGAGHGEAYHRQRLGGSGLCGAPCPRVRGIRRLRPAV